MHHILRYTSDNAAVNMAVIKALQGKIQAVREAKESACEEAFHEHMQELNVDLSMVHNADEQADLISEIEFWDQHAPGSHLLYAGVRADTARLMNVQMDKSFHLLFDQVA